MIEARVDVVPTRVAEGSLTTKQSEREDTFGEIIAAKVPYLCEYVRWAQSKRMVLSVGSMPGESMALNSRRWIDRIAGQDH